MRPARTGRLRAAPRAMPGAVMRGALRLLVAVAAIALGLVAGCQRQVPRPAPPEAAGTTTHLSLATDALFAFGQATLDPKWRHVQLEQLASMLVRRRITAVRLIGYTDRLGNPPANRTLSRRRAETVRDFLVVRGVPPEVFTVEGRGDADPLVRCPDLKGGNLIACLAPNRRVEVILSARD